MKVTQTTILGVVIIEPTVHSDKRGYFFESFKTSDFQEHGLPTRFVQDNQAKSTKGVLRGLHYQLEYPQGKLVWVTAGKVMDVAVDIRKESPTFGQHVSIALDNKTHNRLYIPPGFAHGYYVLSETAVFQYKCTDYYHPEDEHCLMWNDPEVAIDWPINDPILSEKDKQGLFLKDL